MVAASASSFERIAPTAGLSTVLSSRWSEITKRQTVDAADEGHGAAGGTPSVLVWTLSVLFGFTAISSTRRVLSSVVRTRPPFHQYALESYLQAQSSQTPDPNTLHRIALLEPGSILWGAI